MKKYTGFEFKGTKLYEGDVVVLKHFNNSKQLLGLIFEDDNNIWRVGILKPSPDDETKLIASESNFIPPLYLIINDIEFITKL